MVILHAGAPPPASLALLMLVALTLAIFVAAAIVSELQRDDERVVKPSSRSQRLGS